MPENQVEQRASWREPLLNICLSLALFLLTAAMLLTAYIAIFHTGEYVYIEDLRTLLPVALCVSAVPFFLVAWKVSGGDEGTVWQGRAFLIILSLILVFVLSMFLPGILGLWSQGAISRHLREMDLFRSVASWSEIGGDQPANSIDLAGLSPVRSVVIVNGPSFDFQGASMRVSEFNDLLPNGAKAFGTQNLRFVVNVDEAPAGETLSEKWEVYYTRGWDVSKPVPVRYVHIDWHVTLVDLVSERVLAHTILSAEPPSEFHQPLDSKVEIRPTKGALEQWLGFQ